MQKLMIFTSSIFFFAAPSILDPKESPSQVVVDLAVVESSQNRPEQCLQDSQEAPHVRQKVQYVIVDTIDLEQIEIYLKCDEKLTIQACGRDPLLLLKGEKGIIEKFGPAVKIDDLVL